MKYYPVPDEKTNKINWAKTVSAPVIDYDKLLQEYERMKND